MKYILLLSLLFVLASSCHHVYYAPNTATAPLFSEKGESRINGTYSAGSLSNFDGGELQFAHAVSKNIGIVVNGLAGGRADYIDDASTSHTELSTGSYAEIGGGYFRPLDKRGRWILEGYAGGGLGTVRSDYGFGDRSRVGISKVFLQPSIGFRTPIVELAFVPRMSIVGWKVKKAMIDASRSPEAAADMEAIRSQSSFFSFEPTVLFRVGGKGLKAQLAFSFADYKNSSVPASRELGETLTTSIGFSLDLKPRNK